jgi:hypothetical protein
MHKILIAASTALTALCEGPLFIRSNYFENAQQTIGKVMSEENANCILSQLEGSCCKNEENVSVQAPELLIGFHLEDLTASKVVHSDFVKDSGSSLFIPFLADNVVLQVPEHPAVVGSFSDFIEYYHKGERKFFVLVSDLNEANLFVKQVEDHEELVGIKFAAYICRPQPKIIGTSRRRRRLSESDDDDYRVYCTPKILTGLLVGLILLTIAYCGFTTMMDIQIPLRTRAKELPVRKEF